MTFHDTRFPGESDEYRRSRDELLQAELDLRRQVEAVAAQRRALLMWPLWAVLDRTPEGRGTDWWPSLSYSA